jgi:hypothetical protein
LACRPRDDFTAIRVTHNLAFTLRTHSIGWRIEVTQGPEERGAPAQSTTPALVQQTNVISIDDVSAVNLAQDLICHVLLSIAPLDLSDAAFSIGR